MEKSPTMPQEEWNEEQRHCIILMTNRRRRGLAS
jgi:hypothetical protein